MKAILISGLFPTKDENGLIQLALEIESIGIETCIHHHDDKSIDSYGADVFIGFSLGGNRAFQISKTQPVKWLGLIEPVGSWVPWIWNCWKKFEIPKNVLKCDAFQRDWPLMPPSGLIANPSEKYINHLKVKTDHANAPRNSYIINTIIKRVSDLH